MLLSQAAFSAFSYCLLCRASARCAERNGKERERERERERECVFVLCHHHMLARDKHCGSKGQRGGTVKEQLLCEEVKAPTPHVVYVL